MRLCQATKHTLAKTDDDLEISSKKCFKKTLNGKNVKILSPMRNVAAHKSSNIRNAKGEENMQKKEQMVDNFWPQAFMRGTFV